MNILLTGGTGYIGSHTAVVLEQSGHQVVLFDNLSNSSRSVVNRIARITGKRSAFIQGDIRDQDLLRNTLIKHDIHAVIHFAGLKAVGESVTQPVNYYANNVQGTISLLQAMQATGVTTLVFSSSATVYGQPQYLPLDEDHPTSATNPYGRSKLYIEGILQDLVDSSSDWRIACLRYFNPVGAHESGLIGENPQGTPNNLMPFIAQVASGQRNELSVFGSDYLTADGTGIRDYIHVMDLAEGHAAALQYLETHPGFQAINLGTGVGYSVLEMIKSFEHASSRPIPYKFTVRRQGDVAECYANPNKAFQLLGWKAHRTLDDMCSSTWKFQQAVSETYEI
ncbi:UDP-glucose 4-epimerase [Novimethylophilus kurashikiensis]|uniref:UDP-glucose 4-epimerase n=1 Tax=Novimethylophilus kurashikiensis TaxID=1825523 RepID=A0A2R5F5U7_9PROT|nr:UDP-glucose 4-epimerase GalE [Novimethylophilus kurashikiensis]GBG13289.1 UDP-glucose 4-epimerase [Novimethylophilus kurashikiensis]